MTLTITQLLNAEDDVVAMVNEHRQTENIAEMLGIPEDQWRRLQSACATAADESLMTQDAITWPPETRTERQCGLALAWSMGALTMLQAMRGRDDAA